MGSTETLKSLLLPIAAQPLLFRSDPPTVQFGLALRHEA